MMWAPIPGFEGRYEVSDEGQIRSLIGAPHLLAPFGNGRTGHLSVNLRKDGRRHPVYVHRAVLAAFVGPPPADAPIARHLDDDPTNNHLSNLTYGTYTENQLDKVRFGNHHYAKRTRCKWGHKYTPETTAYLPSKPNSRICLACRAARNQSRAVAS